MKVKILVSIILVFACFNSLWADNETIKIEDYSYKDGLTASGVNSAFKDSRGFLWLCTANGLFRYDGYSFRNLNSLNKDTLSTEVYCITEDSYNNYWIGTGKGLIYYNSHLEKLYPVQIDLKKNFRINQILIIKNKVWIASSIGLFSIDSKSPFDPDKTYKVKVLNPDSLHRRTNQEKIINRLYYKPGSQSLWVGTNGALYEYNLHKQTFTSIFSFFQNSIRGLSKYKNGIIASSWDGGVFVTDSTRKIQNDKFINEVNKVIGDKRVMSAILDKKNRLWVATSGNGLYIFEKDQDENVSFINCTNDQKQQEYLKSDFINQLYIDNNDIVWLCMNQPTLSKVYFRQSYFDYFNFFKHSNDPGLKEILSVNQSTDKNLTWICTNGGGIYLFNTKTRYFVQFTDKSTNGLQLQNNEVFYCYQDNENNLWIVYRRIGIYFVPSRTVERLMYGRLLNTVKPIDANFLLSFDRRINSYITTFYNDSKGRLWIGSWGSLNILEPKEKSPINNTKDLFSNYKLVPVFSEFNQGQLNFPLAPVLSIIEIDKGKYFIGMGGSGIVQLTETAKNKFSATQLPITNKLPSANVKILHKGRKNDLWIGTNSGLTYWNLKSDNLITFTSKNGLSSDNINNIVEDKNSNIWVSTSYGISEIKIKDFSPVSFVNGEEKFNLYIQNAGMLTTDKQLCFSTNESIVFANPDSIETFTRDIPLYFTDIKIDNKTIVPLEKYNGTVVIKTNINECKSINVPYNHTLTLEFGALDYVNSSNLAYKYRIGFQNEWILLNSNQRSLSLPNLKSGEYNLSIMLANSSGKDKIRTIKINYLPPFWKSKLAIIIYILILIAVFVMYRKYTVQKITHESLIEKERYERKKLEELDKMKTEFFSNISHEFRTPLSLIINPLDKLAKDESISDKNKERIKLILKSSNRLLKLTNEMMDFSKIEKNLLIPEFENCELVSFVTQICSLFDNLADSMNIDYKLNCSLEKLEITIDKGMIEKVIFNLLSNAFKYTPVNGTVMVNITNHDSDENNFAKISVINTGEGIDSQDILRVFDRYYQVNNMQNRNIEGTGIGLAIVKSFVELHNGKVEVKSEKNLETCFDVYLPITQPGFKADDLNLNSANIEKETVFDETKSKDKKPTYHYRLLVVEDEDDIRKYIVDELSADFKITTAKNGEEGIKIANEMIPDLIITDVIMPVLTGIELCKRLKNQLITSHIPIIILSAKSTVEEQIEGLEMGADIYMVKPFSIEHLKTQIVRLIQFKETVYSRYLKENVLVPKNTITSKLDEEFMAKITKYIEDNLSNVNLSVDQLANKVNLSNIQTYRKVKAISGLSVVEFIRTIRLKKAAELVLEKRLSFAEIAFETGFSTPSYFTKCFHDHFGKTPSEYASDYGK
jgi:signal transduction histidine kinase/ligand-binding sensor domain-containing protein/DNA-binding response OmpR family regulator